MTFFNQLGGPLATQFLDCTQEDAGMPVELNDRAWTRGEVCQVGAPGLAEITAGWRDIDGVFGHAGAVNATATELDTTGWYAVVTSASVGEDAEGRICVHGACQVDVAMALGETLAVGDPVYVNGGAQALEPAAPTNGRAVGIALEAVADQGGNVTVTIPVLFNGIPQFLGG